MPCIRQAELTAAGQHAAAVDDDGKSERLAIFQREGFGGELASRRTSETGAAVENDSAMPVLRSIPGAAWRRIEHEGIVLHFERQARQRSDVVHAAAGEQNEAGVVPPAVFQQIDGALQIVLDELAAAGLAVDAGQHAGDGGGVDDPIAVGKRFEIAGAADIAVDHADAGRHNSCGD